MSELQNSTKGVTPAKAGVQKSLKRLDSRFRGNDKLVVLQLASMSIFDDHHLIYDRQPATPDSETDIDDWGQSKVFESRLP